MSFSDSVSRENCCGICSLNTLPAFTESDGQTANAEPVEVLLATTAMAHDQQLPSPPEDTAIYPRCRDRVLAIYACAALIANGGCEQYVYRERGGEGYIRIKLRSV